MNLLYGDSASTLLHLILFLDLKLGVRIAPVICLCDFDYIILQK